VAFTYYGISLNISGFGLNLYLTQFIYGAIEMPSKLVAYVCLDKLGRRYSQVGTLITTGVCTGITVLIPRGKGSGTIIYLDTTIMCDCECLFYLVYSVTEQQHIGMSQS